MKKLKLFLSLDWKKKKLLIEAVFYLAWACMLKKIPFSKVARSLGDEMHETVHSLDLVNHQMLRQVSQAVQLMSSYTFWESTCLVQAIAAMKMLEKRNIESTLYLGTAKDGRGKLIAHAWLRSGAVYITGAKEMHKFTVVNKFAKNI